MGPILLAAFALVTSPPSLSIRAFYRAPHSSIASYILLPPKTVELRAVVAWPDAEEVDGWLLEVLASALAEWFEWERAATLPAGTTSHVVSLAPGLAYRFRLAGRSDADGPWPFSEPTPPISPLGDPLRLSAQTPQTPSPVGRSPTTMPIELQRALAELLQEQQRAGGRGNAVLDFWRRVGSISQNGVAHCLPRLRLV